jgi:hypothetical protein
MSNVSGNVSRREDKQMRHFVSVGLVLVVLSSASGSATAAAVTGVGGTDLARSTELSDGRTRDAPSSQVPSQLTSKRVTVPIPSALWLFASGVIGLISVTRRTA